MNDLSDLEQRRLDNIRRNAQFLFDLGIDSTKVATKVDEASKLAAEKKKAQAQERQNLGKRRKSGGGVGGGDDEEGEGGVIISSSRSRNDKLQPVRQSRRLKMKLEDKQEVDLELENEIIANDEEDDAEKPIDYTEMPMDSNDLDDFEFEVYVFLKAWRLKTCRELDIEVKKRYNYFF